MKRSLIVSTSTLAGLVAVLALNPDERSASGGLGLAEPASTTPEGSTAPSATPEGGAVPSATPEGTPSATPDASASTSSDATSGTFTGTAVEVRDFGVVQVQITTVDGRVTDVTAVQAPDWDHRSAMISSYSIPELVSQAIDAQSADIAGVSGATFTSVGFAQSLQAALARAGIG